MSLSPGIYKLTNVSLDLPLTPQAHAVNADIIALADDLTDMFKVRCCYPQSHALTKAL